MFIEEEKVQEKGINIMEYFIYRLHNIQTKYSVLNFRFHVRIYMKAKIQLTFVHIFRYNLIQFSTKL